MRPEDSVLLLAMSKEMRNLSTKSDAAKEDLLAEAAEKCVTDAKYLLPGAYKWAHRNADTRLRARVRHANKTRRHLYKRFAPAFRALDIALASAEFVNSSLLEALRDYGVPEGDNTMFGVDSSLGGPLAVYMMLIAIHGRMISIATEISFLLQAGFTESAAARSRTLYELLVKTLVILSDFSVSGFELAERFYVSAIVEGSRNNPQLDEMPRKVLCEARKRWGETFLAGQHNWALPAMKNRGSQKKTLTFGDLERLVSTPELHTLYLAGNDATHAGALRLVTATDFRRPYLYNARCEVDLYATGWIGHATAFYLQVGIFEITERLTSVMRQWDYLLSASEFMRQIRCANEIFRSKYDHPVDGAVGLG